MLYTSQEISRINSSRSASQGKVYHQDNGNVWRGTYNKTLILEITAIPLAVGSEELFDKLITPKITQVEVDFGTTGILEKTFVVNNPEATLTSFVIANVAYAAPTSKTLDELEMDDLVVKGSVTNPGYVNLYVSSTLRHLLIGKFKINYLIN